MKSILLAFLFATQSILPPPKPNIEQLKGEWVQGSYLSALKTRQLPLKQTNPETVRIFSDAEGSHFYWTDHHEAVSRKIMTIAYTSSSAVLALGPVEGDPYADSAIKTYTIYFQRDPHGRITSLRFGKLAQHSHEPFVRVDEGLERRVNRLLLAGRYRGAEGRPYVFSEDQTAIFPNRRFRYAISLDTVLSTCSYFVIREKDPIEAMGYQRQGNALMLFKVNHEDVYSCENKPFAVLRRERD